MLIHMSKYNVSELKSVPSIVAVRKILAIPQEEVRSACLEDYFSRSPVFSLNVDQRPLRIRDAVRELSFSEAAVLVNALPRKMYERYREVVSASFASSVENNKRKLFDLEHN